MRKLTTPEMHRLTIEEFREAEKLPLVVVLDDVRSMYNVGSVFRTCDAFRIEELWLCGITGTPPHTEIHKTALGAEDSVAWRHCATALEAVRSLQQRGFRVYAIEQAEGSTKLQNLPRQTVPRPCLWQRGEGRPPGGGRCVRRLPRNTAVWHEALPQRQRHGGHGDMGAGAPGHCARGGGRSGGALT